MYVLHFTALRNDNIHIRHVLAAVARFRGLHLLDDVHTVDDLAEDDVLAVEEGGGDGGDEELGTVGIRTSILTRG